MAEPSRAERVERDVLTALAFANLAYSFLYFIEFALWKEFFVFPMLLLLGFARGSGSRSFRRWSAVAGIVIGLLEGFLVNRGLLGFAPLYICLLVGLARNSTVEPTAKSLIDAALPGGIGLALLVPAFWLTGAPPVNGILFFMSFFFILAALTGARDLVGWRPGAISPARSRLEPEESPEPPVVLSVVKPSVEVESEPDAGPSPDRPTLVDSGSFRVDEEKALEKLAKFQLEDPADFVLPLVRAAVAADASRVELSRVEGALELRFDGEPLSAKELASPYQALFDDAGSAAGRQLAFGLLAASRLGPSGAALRSSKAEGTLLRLEWDQDYPAGLIDLSRAVRAYGLTKTRLIIDGEEVADRPGDVPIEDRAKGAGFALPALDWDESRLFVYVHGMRVGGIPIAMRGAPVEVRLREDDIPLDASQGRALKGKALDRLLKEAKSLAEKLLEAVWADGAPAIEPLELAAMAQGVMTGDSEALRRRAVLDWLKKAGAARRRPA